MIVTVGAIAFLIGLIVGLVVMAAFDAVVMARMQGELDRKNGGAK